MPRFYRECRIKDKQELFLKVYQEEKAECSCVLRVCCIAAGYKENKEDATYKAVEWSSNNDKEVQRTNGVVRSYMQECIENLIVIKSFANEHGSDISAV